MRDNLKIFRIRKHLTQAEMAEKIGYSRSCYQSIENGTNAGRDCFWRDLQAAFGIPDSEMWNLKRNDL